MAFLSRRLSSVVDWFKSLDPSRGGWAANVVDRASLAACKLQTSLESTVISIPHLFHGNYKNNSDLYLTAYHEGESYLRGALVSAPGGQRPINLRPRKGFVSSQRLRPLDKKSLHLVRVWRGECTIPG